MNTHNFFQVASYLSGNLRFNTHQITFYNEDRTQALGSIPLSPCPLEGCSNCYSPSSLDGDMMNFAYTAGDVLIGAVFPLHNSGKGAGFCKPFHL